MTQEENPSFCILPWVHLQFGEQGKVKSCCISSTTYGNLNDSSISEIWNGKVIQEFRNKLTAGIKDNRCSACYKQEDAGKRSMRLWANHKFSSYIKRAQKPTNIPSPIYWDIRFNNVCNLKCRTCWHGASSSWYEEGKLLKRSLGDKAIIPYIPNEASFIKQLEPYLNTTIEIYFAGGEPLFTDSHYTLLTRLIELKKTDIELRYNTNFTSLKHKNHHLLELWKSFKTVTLGISIDHIKEKGEYVRKGLRWEKLKRDLQQIKKSDYITTNWHPTVSLFNILDLCEIHQYFIENNYFLPDEIELNLLSRPNYFNINLLPLKEKEDSIKNISLHIEYLKRKGAQHKTIQQFNDIKSYLKSSRASATINHFFKEIDALDIIRNEKFDTVYPELKHWRQTS